METKKFGRYEIKSELGRGGMGTVFHAYDPRFRRNVALKVLPREFLHDPNFRARFEQEAQTIALLEHPAIVPVYDYGEEDGQPYLVMRFLTGGTLTNRLEKGALPLDDIIRIINRMAPALSEAHEQGIIHRDLKPDNIIFDKQDNPYISDFGLVKLTQSSSNLTSGNVIVGTPAYMSPEQARGEAVVDGRSDVYALGVILFEMLTGQLPYQANTPVGLVMQHIIEPVPRILEIKPNLPPGCDTIISQAMAKDPDDRYSTAPDLASALANSTHPKATSQSAPSAPPGIPVPVPLPRRAEENENSAPEQSDKSTDPAPQPQSVNFAPDAALSPAPPRQMAELTCPNCAAPLPTSIAPNQPIECSSCGSRFMMSAPEVGESIICPACQTSNPDALRYCAGCGERLKIDCVRCHTRNRIDATHCANCGTNLQSAEERRREIQENRRRMQEERDEALKQKKARQLQEKINRLIDEMEDPAKQEFAVYQLTQIGDPAVKALADTVLTDSSRNARYGAAKTLGEICIKHEIKAFTKARGVKALIKALEDPAPPVRFYSAEALGKLKGKQAQLAVEPLGVLLKDSHENVRQQARASLEKIGGPRAQEILDNSKGFMSWLKG